MQKITPFHVAVPVHNLDECRIFTAMYLGVKKVEVPNNG